MVRIKTNAFNDNRIYTFCKELTRRKLIASSHPHNLFDSGKNFKMISQTTILGNLNNLRALPATVYAGFDPTADSLHVGNLLVISNLLRCSLYGCKPIALLGGATALIGDPTGRSSGKFETF
jgi:tyrosyl-tRNA synthetase